MNRRNFSGSILGTFIVTKLPWYSNPIIIEPKGKKIMNIMELLLHSKEDIIRMIKGIIACDTASCNIEQPNLKDIQFIQYTHDLLEVKFKFEDILMHQQLITNGAGLIFKENNQLVRSLIPFDYQHILYNGDILKCNLSWRFNGISKSEINRIGRVNKIINQKLPDFYKNN